MTDPSETLQQLCPQFSQVFACRAVGGGCISQAFRVSVWDDSLDRRRDVFVKRNSSDFAENFDCEVDGLRALHAASAQGSNLKDSKGPRDSQGPDLIIPSPIAAGVVGRQSHLVLGWLESTDRPSNFFSRFGRALALLHRCTAGQRIGWDRDNFLGAARQLNRDSTSWPDFFAEHRIGYQLQWAVDSGSADAVLRSDCEQIIRRMDELLAGRGRETSLLHGDLWSGNYLCTAEGTPAMIDPAVYRGCREAEFGMIELFGGCGRDFYQAYQETWAMPTGWQHRVRVYVLYHLLNHLNLFGAGYLGQCRSLARKILSV